MKRCKVCDEPLGRKSLEQNCSGCKIWAQNTFKKLRYKIFLRRIFPIAEEA